MVDKKHLNRIRGVLSAKNGAELPKYTVQPGDTLNRIVLNYNKTNNTNLSWQDVAVWNNIPDPNKIQPGQILSFTNPSQTSSTVPGANPAEGNPNASVQAAANVNAQQNAAVTTGQAQQQAQETIAKTTNRSLLIPFASLNTNEAQQAINKTISENTAGINLDKADKLQSQAKWTNAIGQGSAALINGVGQVFAAKQQATDSNLTKTTDTVYGGVAEVAKNMGPVGQLVGTAMQNAKIAGDIIQELGGGTDQQTTTDKWMDSALFSWNIGMLNGFAGKNSDSFGVDRDTFETVGSSYGGTSSDLLDAEEKAGKKYGLFSSNARKKANAAIAKAKTQQNLMGDIAGDAADQRLAVQSMGEQAGLAYSMMANGGYDQKYTYAAKQGGSLEWNPVIVLDWEPQIELNWELPAFKEGGNIDINEELEWIPELQSGNKINLDEVRKYYKDYDLSNVEFITDESPRTEGNKLYISNEEDAVHELWHYLSNNQPNEVYKDYYDGLNDDRIIELGGDLQFVKRFENDPGHFYHPSELEARIKAAKFKTQGQTYTKEFFQNLRKDENKYGNNMRDLLHMYNDDNLVKIFSLKRGGSLGDSDIPEIEETTQKNVIPEGALHKNKHHMEHAEGLTKKGIPVIDDDGDQQAEIEHSEIIFTLEVTKKLEEYYETFYSDESSNKEKEQAALDAGKLLVYQILENTEDRTGLIDSCKKGGTLTFKKSTEDLIEEALEWMPTIVVIEEESTKTSKKKEEKSDKEAIKEVIKEVLVELLIK